MDTKTLICVCTNYDYKNNTNSDKGHFPGIPVSNTEILVKEDDGSTKRFVEMMKAAKNKDSAGVSKIEMMKILKNANKNTNEAEDHLDTTFFAHIKLYGGKKLK